MILYLCAHHLCTSLIVYLYPFIRQKSRGGRASPLPVLVGAVGGVVAVRGSAGGPAEEEDTSVLRGGVPLPDAGRVRGVPRAGQRCRRLVRVGTLVEVRLEDGDEEAVEDVPPAGRVQQRSRLSTSSARGSFPAQTYNDFFFFVKVTCYVLNIGMTS